MNLRGGRLFLSSLLIAGSMLAFSSCSSQNPQISGVATTASPTPDASATATPAPTDVASNPASGLASGSASGQAAGATAGGGANSGGAAGSSAAPAPPPPPRIYTLAAGSTIPVWTTSTISTKTAKAGDTFVATLGRAITDGDWVIAKKGATVEGVVVDSDPGGKVKGRASLTLALSRLALADGRTIDLDTSKFTREAKGTKKKDAAKIGIGAGIGAAIGAIAGGGKGAAIGAGVGGAGTGMVLATRGDPAVIGSETQLTFRLTSPVTVTKR